MVGALLEECRLLRDGRRREAACPERGSALGFPPWPPGRLARLPGGPKRDTPWTKLAGQRLPVLHVQGTAADAPAVASEARSRGGVHCELWLIAAGW